MSVVNFVGRRADILAFQGVFPDRGEQQTTMSLFLPGTGGLLCTGVQKLAQRLLLTLLTKRGSIRHLPTFGTNFVLDGEVGSWRTTGDVSNSFYAARLDLLRQMRLAEDTLDPDDERIDSTELTGVTVEAGRVSVRLSLSTLAGSSYVFVAPIAVTVK